MYIELKQDLSVLQFLRTLFSDAPFIKVVDGFPEEEFDIPTVALETDSITAENFEMGNREFAKQRYWYIDVYAVSKAQRDEIAYRIIHALEEKIPVYDFDQGFPPTVIPRLGVLDPDNVQLKVIKILPELTELMYYRSVVNFTTFYEEA